MTTKKRIVTPEEIEQSWKRLEKMLPKPAKAKRRKTNDDLLDTITDADAHYDQGTGLPGSSCSQ